MGYRLGIDLGGTTLVAAVAQPGSAVELVMLGEDRPAGSAQALRDPGLSDEEATAALLRFARDRASVQFGNLPDEVVVSQPGHWNEVARASFDRAVALADLGVVRRTTQAEAAACSYAARTHLPVGARVVVFNLGGGSCEASVLERSATGFTVLGTSGGPHPSGADFDEAVFRLVLGGAGQRGRDLTDPAALAAIRRACVTAKERLSTEVFTDVTLPTLDAVVRLSRVEVDSLIRGPLREGIALVGQVLAAAGVAARDLTAVLAVGGCSRMPIVKALLAKEVPAPIVEVALPEAEVAIGAAGGVAAFVQQAGPVGAPPLVAPATQIATPPVAPAPQVAPKPGALASPVTPPPAVGAWPPGAVAAAPPVAGGLPPQPLGGVPAAFLGSASLLPQNFAASPVTGPPAPLGPAIAAPYVASSPYGAYAPPPPPVLQPVPPAEPAWPATGGQPGQFGTVGARSAQDPGKGPRRPSPWVLAIVGAVALAALVTGVLAFNTGGNPKVTLAPRPSSSSSAPVPPGPTLPEAEPIPEHIVVVPVRRAGETDTGLQLVDSTGERDPVDLPAPVGDNVNPLMQPSRKTIIYLHGGVLRVMGSDGSGDRLLIDRAPAGCDSILHASWNRADPNALLISCQGRTVSTALLLIDLQGTLIRRLETGRKLIGDFSVSPDGRTAAYWASDDLKARGGSIFTMPVSGPSKPKRLTKDVVDSYPVWSPDGARIAFSRRIPNGTSAGNLDVFTMNANGSGVKPLASTPAADFKAVWSPDGRNLLVISNRTSTSGGIGRTYDLWLTRVSDGKVLLRIDLKAARITRPFWTLR